MKQPTNITSYENTSLFPYPSNSNNLNKSIYPNTFNLLIMRTETNNLIAVFMGLAYNETYLYEGWYKNSEFNDRICSKDMLKYYYDWNWLIPVIKKIREVVNTELSIDDFDKHRGLEQRLNPYNYDIDSIHKGCVEFIKWYNQQSI